VQHFSQINFLRARIHQFFGVLRLQHSLKKHALHGVRDRVVHLLHVSTVQLVVRLDQRRDRAPVRVLLLGLLKCLQVEVAFLRRHSLLRDSHAHPLRRGLQLSHQRRFLSSLVVSSLLSASSLLVSSLAAVKRRRRSVHLDHGFYMVGSGRRRGVFPPALSQVNLVVFRVVLLQFSL